MLVRHVERTALMAATIHDRMPFFIDAADYIRWLSAKDVSTDLLKLFPAE